MDNGYDYLFKLVLVGDSNVGKSSLLCRYVDNVYDTNYISTIGVDFKIITVNNNNKMVKLQIWDTAGQERFKSITSNYYRGVDAAILVFDVSDINSYYNVESEWINTFKKQGIYDKQHCKVLVGNKNDKDICIKKHEAEEFANRYDMRYFEASAKTSKGVSDIFNYIVSSLVISHKYLDNEKKYIPTIMTPHMYHYNGCNC